MTSGSRNRAPSLSLVKGTRSPEGTAERAPHEGAAAQPGARKLDWSILMARTQEGDGDAYRRLLEQITPYLRTLAIRCHRDASDVEDAVQDILLTIHAIRHTYDPRRPFGPWLAAIARRRLVDRLRRQGRLRSRETPLTPEQETFPAPPANSHEEVWRRRDLERAVGDLPAGQRQAIRLLKLNELTLKEAAAATGMSIASLKVTTHRAIKNLRKMLSQGSEDT